MMDGENGEEKERGGSGDGGDAEQKALAGTTQGDSTEGGDGALEGIVYFIRNGGIVKIGYTRDLPSRLRSLRTAAPHIRVLLALPGNRAIESWLHSRFAPDHEAGEWFRYSNALREFVSNPRFPDVSFFERKPGEALTPSKMGRRGGKSRAKNMTAEQRRESARNAARARWGTKKGEGDTEGKKAGKE